MVRIPSGRIHSWMTEEILQFLGQVKNGPDAFWITDRSTPVWSGNVAYRTSLFTGGLRFDHRYNRQGSGVGGGSDVIMFFNLLEKKCRIRYRLDMMIEHCVGTEKLRRQYFLSLHFKAGKKSGQYNTDEYKRNFMGVPPFMFVQAMRHWIKALRMFINRDKGLLRQAMNGTYATGMIFGQILKWCSLKDRR